MKQAPVAAEEGEPGADTAAYRRCLAAFATGVTVMTTQAGGAPAGMSVNSFASVSLDPPLILWSIKRSSQSLAAFQGSSHFAVNVLAADQMDLSQAFSRSGTDKFAGVAWHPGIEGVPLLPGVLASFECRRSAEYDGGDHVIMLGEVLRFRRFERSALLFAQGRYGIAADHPGVRPALEPLAGEGSGGELLTISLRRAYASLVALAAEAREVAGLTTMQARMLKALEAAPGRPLEHFRHDLLIGLNASQDLLDELVAMKFAAVRGDGGLQLSADGQKRLTRLLDRAQEMEDEYLKSVSAEDLAATRRVLAALIERERDTDHDG